MKIRVRRILLGVLGFTILLFSNTEYQKGIEYFEAGVYDKAFPLILKESQKGINRAAQYRLAEMYEKGLGTEVDYKRSSYWYKQAASDYAYVEKKLQSDTESSSSSELDLGIDSSDDIKKGNEFALAKLDTGTPETKSLLSSLIDGDFFGLKPYKANYFLPFSYSKDKPNRVDALYGYNGLSDAYKHYNKNIEVQFQLSVQKQLSYDFFGLNEYISFAYTQKVWWQLYDVSAPFRETNYQPELFVTIPTSQQIDDNIGLKGVKFGFIHESNGQEGYRSRSWNRLYATGLWQWDNLFLSTRVWYRLKENRRPDWYYEQSVHDSAILQAYSDGDENPDIEDYLGYGDIKVSYLYGKSHFGLLLRNNLDFDENRGAIEFTYAYPFFNSPNTYWYTKIFTGYGESLIDYNVDVTRASFGFSFSGEIF